jgi:hypothetical protein
MYRPSPAFALLALTFIAVACASGSTDDGDDVPASTSYCDALGRARAKCQTSFDESKCLNDTKGYSGATIDKAEKCTSKDCSEIDACLAGAFGTVVTVPVPVPDAGDETEPPPDDAGSNTTDSGNGTDSGDNDSGGKPATCPALNKANTAFLACMAQHCCAEATQCANSDCGYIDQCIGQCGNTQACANYCGSQFPDGIDDYNALIQCGQDNCKGL